MKRQIESLRGEVQRAIDERPSQEQLVYEFNQNHPVGTVVDYWRGEKKGPPSGSGKTSHPATLLSGHTAVAWIEGCSGCISLSHVQVKGNQ